MKKLPASAWAEMVPKPTKAHFLAMKEKFMARVACVDTRKTPSTTWTCGPVQVCSLGSMVMGVYILRGKRPRPKRVAKTIEVAPDVFIDYDRKGRVIGVEVLP